MKRSALFAACLMAALLLCGCGSGKDTAGDDTGTKTPPVSEVPEKLSANDVLQKMRHSIIIAPATHLKLAHAIQIDFGGEEGFGTVATEIVDLSVCRYPYSAYGTISLEQQYVLETVHEEYEKYVVPGETGFVTYEYTDGAWNVQDEDVLESYRSPFEMITECLTEAKIEESVTEYEGKEVICLVARETGVIIQKELSELLYDVIKSNYSNTRAVAAYLADYSMVTCDIAICVDSETYLPVTVQVDISGLGDVIAAAVDPEEYEQMPIDIPRRMLAYEVESCEPLETIRLPQGAPGVEGALAVDPSNGDGTFTITEGDLAIDLKTPEGFTVVDSTYDTVLFENADGLQVKYNAWKLWNEDPVDGYFQYEVEYRAGAYEILGEAFCSDAEQYTADTMDYTAMSLTHGADGTYTHENRAWSHLGGDEEISDFLYIAITETSSDAQGTVDESMLTEFVNCASLRNAD